MLRPVGVPEVPVATAALARRAHPRGTDEMRVRDALGPLFRDEDFTAGEFEDTYPRLGQPGLSPASLLLVTILGVPAQPVRPGSRPGDHGPDLLDLRPGPGPGLRLLRRLGGVRVPRPPGRGRPGSSPCWIGCWRGCRRPGWFGPAGDSAPIPRTCSPVCVGPDRIESVGEGLRAALEEIARIAPGWLVGLGQVGWDERSGHKVKTARLLGRTNASAQKLAEQIGADGQALLAAIDATRPRPG